MPEDTRDPAKVAYDAQVAADEAAKRLGDKLAGDTRIDYSGLLGQPPTRPSYEDCSQLQQPGIVQTGAVVASALNGFWGNVRSFFGADPHEQYAQAAALQMYAQGKNRCWQGVTEQATAYLKATDRYARERLAAGKALEEVAREARAAQGMNMGPEAWAGERRGAADAAALRPRAQALNVDFRPGINFSGNDGLHNYLRLSFAFYNAARLEEGARRLGQVLK